MVKYTKEDIKGVEFVFENCESVYVPQDCFDQFKLIGDTRAILECIIVDRGIKNFCVDKRESPIQRLRDGQDISLLELKFADEREDKEIYLLWEDDWSQYNKYQSCKSINYNDVYISVKEDNLKFSIKEVLNMNAGTVVKAVNSGALYTVESKLNVKYLKDAYVTEEILCEKFTLAK